MLNIECVNLFFIASLLVNYRTDPVLFGTYMEENGLALRGTFIIDPDGVLKTVEMHDLGIGRSAVEALRKLEAAKFVREHGDQVCPAAWTPGDETLTPGLDLVGKI